MAFSFEKLLMCPARHRPCFVPTGREDQHRRRRFDERPSAPDNAVYGNRSRVLYIETGGLRLLVDPWLSGSCYWRSWWHFPPNTPILPEHLSPDIIYISHHHFDHFHYPSLRKLDKRAHVFIPRFAVDVMRHELQGIGFNHVTEMRHGDVLTIGPDVRIASYQYGPDDSAFVVSHAGTTLVDLNDCKIKGSVAKPIVNSFGRPKFIFKSHSFAQAYPNCYTFEDKADARLMTKEDFIETFITTIKDLKPEYAVPFASMVAFLHPDSWPCNEHAVKPTDVAAEANRRLPGTQTVVMTPGDTWNSDGGFVLQPVDYYSNREHWLRMLEERAHGALVGTIQQETEQSVSFDMFRTYFRSFLQSVPRVGLVIFRRPVAFLIRSSEKPYWMSIPFVARSTQLTAHRKGLPWLISRKVPSPTRLPNASSTPSTSPCASESPCHGERSRMTSASGPFSSSGSLVIFRFAAV